MPSRDSMTPRALPRVPAAHSRSRNPPLRGALLPFVRAPLAPRHPVLSRLASIPSLVALSLSILWSCAPQSDRDDLIAYVKEAELLPLPLRDDFSPPPREVDDGTVVAFHLWADVPNPERMVDRGTFAIVEGSITAFQETLSSTARSDVLDTTYFASMRANAKHKRFEEPQEWIRAYIEELQSLGWFLRETNDLSQAAKKRRFRMDVEALTALQTIADAGLLSGLKEHLERLDQGSDDELLASFESFAASGRTGNFQLGSAALDPETGRPLLALGAYHFTVSTRRKKFLFFEWDASAVNFWAEANVMTLLESYDYLRQGVKARIRKSLEDSLDGSDSP